MTISDHRDPIRNSQQNPQFLSEQCYPHRMHPSDGIDLMELISVVWAGRWFIGSVTFIAAALSVGVALYLPNIYRSEALLAPTDEVQGGGISGMAGQLGGLASLAGINIGAPGSSDKVSVAVAVMSSKKFITDFIKEHDLLPELMAAKNWDQVNDVITFDREIYDSEQKKWVREVEWPKKPIPSDWEAYKAFNEIYEVTRDDKTGFVKVTVEHLSPKIAERWATLVINQINSVMKKDDVSEASRSVEYLQDQLNRIPLAEMRSVFYQLIEEQTKTMMLAEVRDEYIFATIDPPLAPEEKSSPNRALICIAGTILGSILSLIITMSNFLIKGLVNRLR